MNLEAYFTEAAMRAALHRPERRRPFKWPRLLARFNYREPRTKKGGAG